MLLKVNMWEQDKYQYRFINQICRKTKQNIGAFQDADS